MYTKDNLQKEDPYHDFRENIKMKIKMYEDALSYTKGAKRKLFLQGCITGLHTCLCLIPLPETINVKCEDC